VSKEKPKPKKGRQLTQGLSKASKDPQGKKRTRYEPYPTTNHKWPTPIAKERRKNLEVKKPLPILKVQK